MGNTGSQTITVADVNVDYSAGQDIIVAYDASNIQYGIVSSYSAGTLIFNKVRQLGSGTYSAWNVNLDGAVGIQGYVGSQGVIGYTGSKGDIGYSGSQGYTGSKGDIGYTGSFGYTGSVGYVGSQGYSGSQGYTGSVGYVGSAGVSYIGSTAPTSPYSGETWYNSDTGIRYVYYYDGDSYQWVQESAPGPLGYTGSQGYVGSGSPASNGTGTAGQLAFDSTYLYVCTATNTWKRVALTGSY